MFMIIILIMKGNELKKFDIKRIWGSQSNHHAKQVIITSNSAVQFFGFRVRVAVGFLSFY